jgi:hypothetical protein
MLKRPKLNLAAFAVAILLAVAGVAASREDGKSARVEMPLNLAILIQDDLVSHVSNELRVTRDFIQSLPEGSRVMVGYIRSGSLQVRQPFTSNLVEAANGLRRCLPLRLPFQSLCRGVEALRNFDSEEEPNALLLISDADTSRVLMLRPFFIRLIGRAIKEANRRKVAIWPLCSVGRTDEPEPAGGQLWPDFAQSSVRWNTRQGIL